jgi:hypothetical protein
MLLIVTDSSTSRPTVAAEWAHTRLDGDSVMLGSDFDVDGERHTRSEFRVTCRGSGTVSKLTTARLDVAANERPRSIRRLPTEHRRLLV